MKKRFSLRFIPDFLFVFLLSVLTVLIALGAVFKSVWLLLAALPVAAYLFFRLFSQNSPARIKENEIFSRWFFAIPRAVSSLFRHRQSKTHIRSHCPSCGAALRLENKKGDFTVTCPRCGARFPIHIR